MHSTLWWVALVTYVLVTTNLASLAVSIYLHRELTHKAIVLNPSVRYFFRFIIWFITGMDPVEWKVVHLAHHQAPSDSPDDVHSPKNVGMWKIVAFGVYYYVTACGKLQTKIEAERTLNGDILGKKPWRYIGAVLNLGLNIYLWGFYPGLIVWVIQLVWIPFWAAGVINGLGHGAHEQHEHTRDWSKNILEDGPAPLRVLINFITGGESDHHNHHLRAGSARFADEGKFDWGFTVIKALAGLHLAKVIRI